MKESISQIIFEDVGGYIAGMFWIEDEKVVDMCGNCVGQFVRWDPGRICVVKKINYTTLNLITHEVNVFGSKQEATNYAIDVNKKDNSHPAFYLYSNVVGGSTSKFEGRLIRKFGTDNYEWEMRDK